MKGNESSSGDWFASLVLTEDSIDLGDVGLGCRGKERGSEGEPRPWRTQVKDTSMLYHVQGDLTML